MLEAEFTHPLMLEPSGGVRPATAILLTLLAVICFVIAGNFHVVSGGPKLLVKRTSFGFSDTFASVEDCTSGPKIIVMSLHPSLCNALLRDGIVGDDD
jgi:hypothetical protein